MFFGTWKYHRCVGVLCKNSDQLNTTCRFHEEHIVRNWPNYHHFNASINVLCHWHDTLSFFSFSSWSISYSKSTELPWVYYYADILLHFTPSSPGFLLPSSRSYLDLSFILPFCPILMLNQLSDYSLCFHEDCELGIKHCTKNIIFVLEKN